MVEAVEEIVKVVQTFNQEWFRQVGKVFPQESRVERVEETVDVK